MNVFDSLLDFSGYMYFRVALCILYYSCTPAGKYYFSPAWTPLGEAYSAFQNPWPVGEGWLPLPRDPPHSRSFGHWALILKALPNSVP